MNDIKEKIINFLELNKHSGFFTAEIADAISEDLDDVVLILKSESEFIYDKECESFTGWRLKKYVIGE